MDYRLLEEDVKDGRIIIDLPKVVNGNFDCSNLNLTTLIGCPEIVNGKFSCYANSLTNLIGCPKTINGDFVASLNELNSLKGIGIITNNISLNSNKLTSLKYIQTYTKSLNINSNKLTSLRFAPKYCTFLNISNNELTSLMYCPKVKESILCAYNKLVNLKFCPELNNGGILLINNELTSLEGIPEYLLHLNVKDNALTSLNHRPKKIIGTFTCDDYLSIEKEFIGEYEDYYPELLQHCLKSNIDINLINWPENFITEDLIKSNLGSRRFNI